MRQINTLQCSVSRWFKIELLLDTNLREVNALYNTIIILLNIIWIKSWRVEVDPKLITNVDNKILLLSSGIENHPQIPEIYASHTKPAETRSHIKKIK